MKMTDPATLPDDIRAKLLLAREAFAAGDNAEAHHWIYAIACPGFDCYDPWAALEGRKCACPQLPHRLEGDTPKTPAEFAEILRRVHSPTPDELERFRRALISISSMKDEENEWEAVESYSAARRIAALALSPPSAVKSTAGPNG